MKVLQSETENVQPAEKKLTKPFAMPTAKKSFVGKNFLVALFAMDNDPDYRAMYSQAAQNTVGECVEAWKSFFALKKAGDADAKIPRYKKKEHASVTFSNQGCRIESGMLRLPGTKIKFDVGSFPHCSDKLIEVRVVPYFGHYLKACLLEKENAMRHQQQWLVIVHCIRSQKEDKYSPQQEREGMCLPCV